MAGLAWSKKARVFSQDWVDALKHVPVMTMPCTVDLYIPGETSFDSDTGKVINAEPTYLAQKCPARIQPIRSSGLREIPHNDTIVQSVLVQIPYDIGFDMDVTNSVFMKVTDSPRMPVLEKYVYTAQEIVDSGNIIERTLVFQVDQEARLP